MGFLIGNFLNRMAISFVICLLVMALIRMAKPLLSRWNSSITQPLTLFFKSAVVAGVIVVILTLILYVIFSPLVWQSKGVFLCR